MRELIYPKEKFAFLRKGETTPILALHLGEYDSIDNYDEITEAEYNEILARKAEEAKAREEAEISAVESH
jgi:hypothetical protein